MGCELLARIKCDMHGCAAAIDVLAILHASIQAGGSIEIEVVPEKPHDWSWSNGRYEPYIAGYLCPEHASMLKPSSRK